MIHEKEFEFIVSKTPEECEIYARAERICLDIANKFEEVNRAEAGEAARVCAANLRNMVKFGIAIIGVNPWPRS